MTSLKTTALPRLMSLSLLLILLGAGLAGCDNTVRGAAQDIEDTGEAVAGVVED